MTFTKIFSISLIMCGCSSVSLYATTISLGGSTVYESDALTALNSGGEVSVGYFVDAFDFSSITSDTWNDILNVSYFELSGTYSLSSDGVASGIGTSTGISGKKLYVWFFNGSIATDQQIGSSQEFGLFTGSSPEWTAKGDSPFTDFNDLLVPDVSSAVYNYGSVVTGGIALQAVPEPSTYAALAALCALGTVALRRRRA